MHDVRNNKPTLSVFRNQDASGPTINLWDSFLLALLHNLHQLHRLKFFTSAFISRIGRLPSIHVDVDVEQRTVTMHGRFVCVPFLYFKRANIFKFNWTFSQNIYSTSTSTSTWILSRRPILDINAEVKKLVSVKLVQVVQ